MMSCNNCTDNYFIKLLKYTSSSSLPLPSCPYTLYTQVSMQTWPLPFGCGWPWTHCVIEILQRELREAQRDEHVLGLVHNFHKTGEEGNTRVSALADSWHHGRDCHDNMSDTTETGECDNRDRWTWQQRQTNVTTETVWWTWQQRNVNYLLFTTMINHLMFTAELNHLLFIAGFSHILSHRFLVTCSHLFLVTFYHICF